MFCTTECWECEDRTCEHYISKSKIYFENQELKEQLNKAYEAGILDSIKEAQRLNKIIKELRCWLEEMLDNENDIFLVVRVKDVLSKLNELEKEGKNNEL